MLDKPICRPDQKKIYGVARNEAAEILCQVDAYPPPESFKWSFNNTAETIDMPQSGYRVHAEQASSLTYTPVKGAKQKEGLFSTENLTPKPPKTG
uniref:Ig-like domain-containing protein n=1 Tax=Anopheles epiroticus TaxID=199890 RepID=A0A182P5N9_9DIPT